MYPLQGNVLSVKSVLGGRVALTSCHAKLDDKLSTDSLISLHSLQAIIESHPKGYTLTKCNHIQGIHFQSVVTKQPCDFTPLPCPLLIPQAQKYCSCYYV